MKIAIIGLGYVGLPLALRFAESGVKVIGLDTDPNKVKCLNGGNSYIEQIESARISQLHAIGALEADTNFARVREVEATIICVPTPLNRNREPDISFVLQSGQSIAPYLTVTEGRKPLVVLESTTYPGTTENELRAVLEKGSGLTAGDDFHLAFSPEREDPGRKDFSVKSIPKVMGGLTSECLARCVELYSKAIDHVFPVSSCRIAEAAKLTENIFRSVNIALVNELKTIYDAMQIDVWEVIEAAKTKPFGYMPFYPGPGLGGHCIPIDPFYLTWKAREFGKNTHFIELAGQINRSMPEYVVEKVVRGLNSLGKSVKGSRVLILGLAYKPDVDDDRESPTYSLMRLLKELGATISYHDPHVPEIGPTREHMEFAGIRSSDLTIETIKNAECILIATHHKSVNYGLLAEHASLIVDTRNTMATFTSIKGLLIKA
jgi:UDP-N-acetyl-D-glucosamine dehydrogenase